MKKTPKLKLSKKVVKNLKLKLKKNNDRKAAPFYSDDMLFDPSNGHSC